MAWGLKYIREYTNRHDELCKVEFHFKDYVGAVENIYGSEDSMVVYKEIPDPTEPIQAQAGDMELLTDTQTGFSIDKFYSEDDEYILVRFYYKDSLYFTGFVLQDECADAFVDYQHFIKVTITDNLGLLNDIDFATACGDTDPNQKFTIAEYLKICLNATGLGLPIQIFANIYETTTETREDDEAATFADQTRLYSGCFLDSGGKWQSCFEVLSAILKAFGCIVCQRQGAWVVYRWGELQTLDNTAYPGTQFNSDLTGKTVISLTNTPVIISESRNRLIGGASTIRTITRPYEFTKETFNYHQPAELIKNLALLQIGNLRTTTTEVRDGETITIRKYDAPYWYLDQVEAGVAANDYWIIVETDSRGVEVNRFLVTNTDFGNSIDYVTVSSGVYVNKGDKITVGLSMRSPDYPGSGTYAFYVSIYNGSQRYWLNRNNSGYEDGEWVLNFQVSVRSDFYPNGTAFQDWHIWDVESLQIPIDGWLNIRVGIMSDDGDDTHWKDFRFEYQSYINESTKIEGHTHTQTQNLPTGQTIKNNNETDRFVDDSPRNMIAGTLLTDELTTFSQGNVDVWYPNPASDYVTKTQRWQTADGNERRLGETTTNELKQLYSQLRYKMDCTFIFDDYMDILTTFQIAYLGDINFRLGTINSINFATCQCQAQLWEFWKGAESAANSTYKFEYLYEKD